MKQQLILSALTLATSSMKSNFISPSTLAPTRSARSMDTRAKIIEKVRAGGASAQFLPGPAFNWAFVNDDNVEVTYKSQDESDKPTKGQTDEISLPTTATASSSDDSILGEDIHALNEEDSQALNSVLTEHDVSGLADIVLNIKEPGVGFDEGKYAEANVNADASVISGINQKKVSFDDNNSITIFEDERSEAYSVYSPPKRRLFSCGGADNDLVEDLTLTLRQIFSPIKNAEIVVPEKNKKAFRVMMKEKIRYHYASRNDSNISDESSYSDQSDLHSRKLDVNGRKRSDEVGVEIPDLSSRRLV